MIDALKSWEGEAPAEPTSIAKSQAESALTFPASATSPGPTRPVQLAHVPLQVLRELADGLVEDALVVAQVEMQLLALRARAG
jgi:hypothetical protein